MEGSTAPLERIIAVCRDAGAMLMVDEAHGVGVFGPTGAGLAERNGVAQEIDIPPCVHDVVGGLYFLRTLNVEPGQAIQVPVSDGKKAVMARVEAQQREEVKTPAGTFKTIRYELFLFNGVLYTRSAHLNIWVTDDARRIPVQIRVRLQFTIGTITLLLDKVE